MRSAADILRRWFLRAAAVPPRSVRIIIEIDGRTFIDLDSKLALAMVDCAFGQPVVNEYELGKVGVRLRLTLRSGGGQND